MTPGNRVYVASVSTRHCVYVHPRATAIHALLQTHKHTHTHVEKLSERTVYANERDNFIYEYIREEEGERWRWLSPHQNELTSL